MNLGHVLFFTIFSLVVCYVTESDSSTTPVYYYGNTTDSLEQSFGSTSAARKPDPEKVSAIMDAIMKTSLGGIVTGDDEENDDEDDSDDSNDEQDSTASSTSKNSPKSDEAENDSDYDDR